MRTLTGSTLYIVNLQYTVFTLLGGETEGILWQMQEEVLRRDDSWISQGIFVYNIIFQPNLFQIIIEL